MVIELRVSNIFQAFSDGIRRDSFFQCPLHQKSFRVFDCRCPQNFPSYSQTVEAREMVSPTLSHYHLPHTYYDTKLVDIKAQVMSLDA